MPSPGWSGQYEWTRHDPVRRPAVRVQPTRRACGPTPTTTSAKNSTYFFGREFIDPARYQRIRQVLESKAAPFGGRLRRAAGRRGEPAGATHRRSCLSSTSLRRGRVEAARPRRTAALGRTRQRRFGGGVASTRCSATSWCARGIRRLARATCCRRCWASGRTRCWPRSTRTTSCRRSACWRSSRRHRRRSRRRGVRFGRPSRGSARRLGPNVASAGSGADCTRCSMEHALSVRKPLGLLFNVPAFPWSGDLETVRAGGSAPGALEPDGPDLGVSLHRRLRRLGPQPVVHPRRPEWPSRLAALRRPGRDLAARGVPPAGVHATRDRRVARHTLRLLPD